MVAVVLVVYAMYLYFASFLFAAVLFDPGSIRDLRFEQFFEIESLQFGGVATLIGFGFAAMLLWPIRRAAPGAVTGGRPIWTSILALAVGLACLTIGPPLVVIGVAQAFNWIDETTVERVFIAVVAALALSWVFWSFLLAARMRGESRESLLARWIGMLFAGSVVEMTLALPFDLIVRRRADCYCETGTFLMLWVTGSIVLWVMGPLALVTILWRRRRPFYRNHCPNCGYDKGPTANRPGRCPECGASWE